MSIVYRYINKETKQIEYIFHKIIIEEYSEDIINEVKRIMRDM